MALHRCESIWRADWRAKASDVFDQPVIGSARSSFIFEDAPFASAHASTIAEPPEGLIAAWFGGPCEGHPQVGIWLARRVDGQWSAPTEVARGLDRFGRAQPCWNPVLHQVTDGPLLIFYKVGPSPRRWWGRMSTSTDRGRSWSEPRRLPPGILGPIKNKPVTLPGGAILCPSSTEDRGWRVHLELTSDLGATWHKIGRLGRGAAIGAIQPSIVVYPDRRMQLLCRTRQCVVATAWSIDDGRTWSALAATSLPNPDSGIDAVALRDGRAVLVYNRSRQARTPLCIAVSEDGHAWRDALVLEDAPGEYSYPAVIQAADGTLHVTYTWNRRRIRHVTVAPDRL
jgi:predicted neuraminidase